MDNFDKIVEILHMVGDMKVIDNKELGWSNHKAPPGEACLNCCHYGVYETPTAPVHNLDDEPLYDRPIVVIGFCTEPVLDNMLVVNVPSTGYCPRYEYRDDQFVDDAIDDDTEGREM